MRESGVRVIQELWDIKIIFEPWKLSGREMRTVPLSLRNERWRQDNEPEITGESFRSRIRLQSIVVTNDGQFEFWFEDDDLFRGHAIRAWGNLTEGLISAGLEG